MAKGGGSAVRIESIYISDFRGFPALAPAWIDLKGCNLLVYGENGAGKSSIYRALRGLFSATAQEILPLHNVFTDPPQPSVKVTLTTGKELHWSAAGHPTPDVVDTARKSAFLGHTELLQMNAARTVSGATELFPIVVTTLLADFEVTVEGGSKQTVRELWNSVNDAFTRRVNVGGNERRPRNYIAVVEAACARFNEGMKEALGALEGNAKRLLRQLLDVLQPDALDLVGFTFFGIAYDEKIREIRNRTLTATVKFRDQPLTAPPDFLNEARLSALAIATYLAGRLACIPKADTATKFLVLDDLLISLDYSHRRPVLDVISNEFDGWQIVLLTHDRFWFELAREQLADKPWKAVEIYEKLDADGLLRPVIWESQSDLIAETLKQASRFLDDNQPAAAANYARTACELTLRRYCRNHNILFAYTDQPQKIKLEDLLKKGEAHAKGDVDREAAFKGLGQYKKLILNPLSHDPVQPIVKADVVAAVGAVKELASQCNRHKP